MKKKLLVMDVEGTIFKAVNQVDGVDYNSTMWQPIARALGEAAVEEERIMAEKYDCGVYETYLDWVKATIDMHRKYSLKKSDFERLINIAEYNTGVEEFFNKLDRNEWIPVLISGGFQNLIRRAEKELDIEYGFGACEYFFNDIDGFLEHYNIQPCDFRGKIKFLNTVLDDRKLNIECDWVFVGDGKNDIHIAKKAPKAFCINPHDDLKAVEGITEISSFMELLPYLDNFCKKGEHSEKKVHINEENKKCTDDYAFLLSKVARLKREKVKIKNKYNELKQKMNGETHEVFEVKPIDYQRTPRLALNELTKGLNVVFLGLNESYESCHRLKTRKDIKIVPVRKKIDKQIFKSADFVFIYKNCISHSDLWCAMGDCYAPYCYLLEPTNNEMLENALANMLYRYIFKN